MPWLIFFTHMETWPVHWTAAKLRPMSLSKKGSLLCFLLRVWVNAIPFYDKQGLVKICSSLDPHGTTEAWTWSLVLSWPITISVTIQKQKKGSEYLLVWSFSFYSWIFCLYGDIIITSEGLQIFFSALMAFEQWGFFSMPHLLWQGPTLYNGHLQDPWHTHPLPSV